LFDSGDFEIAPMFGTTFTPRALNAPWSGPAETVHLRELLV